jgi:2,4-dienoyl-CoA reductase (NADPH2)
MAPLYLGYAAEGGKVSRLLLEHYRRMAASGAAMIVVENATITPAGSGADRTLRCDHHRYIPGLAELAETIQKQRAKAALQINHAGRFAHTAEPVAPSEVSAFGRTPRALTAKEIVAIEKQFVAAAQRVKEAGFDLVELHGGTGYLLAQFASPRTNQRSDNYGGSFDNRIRFPLEVLRRVKDAVGDFPVGYRLLADEWLPDGFDLEEGAALAKALEEDGAAYVSVMGGTYESFFLPEVAEMSKKPGYMVPLARRVCKAVKIPVITAGRISTPARAESILENKDADLIGLARMLWVDARWPKLAREGLDRSIRKCSKKCNACMEQVMKGKPAICPHWDKDVRRWYRERISESIEA